MPKKRVPSANVTSHEKQRRETFAFFLSIISSSLHLAHNLTGFAQTFDHLETFFSSSNGVVAFFQEVVEFVGAIHVLEQLPLHFFLGKSDVVLVAGVSRNKRLRR